MNFELKTMDVAQAASEKCDLLVLLVPDGFAPGKDALGALVAQAIKAKDLDTKPGKSLHSYQVAGVAARRVVLAGIVIGVACSLIAAGLDKTTLRIAVASGTAFLLSQWLDVGVFHRLRAGSWWRAPLISTLVSSSLDTAIFFIMAFSAALTALEPANDVSWAGEMLPLLGFGPVVPLWVSLATADWLVKLALAAMALMPFRRVVRRLLGRYLAGAQAQGPRGRP